jgi:hypothetical protein
MFDWMAGDLMFPFDSANQDTIAVGGWWQENPTTQQLQGMLDGPDADGTAQQLEKALTLPVRAAAWHISPPERSTDANAQAIADRTLEVFTRETAAGGMQTPMQQVISQATAAYTLRRSYYEQVWKRDGEQIVIDKLAWRPPDGCRLLRDKKTGNVLGFDQWVPGTPERVKIEAPYAFVYVHGTDRSPVRGRTEMNVVYRNYRTKEKLKFLWATYLEGMALPRVLAVAAGDTQAKELAQAIASLRNAGVVGIPKQWLGGASLNEAIMTLDLSGTGNTAYQEALNWLDADSAGALLASFLNLSKHSTGSSSTGSYALSNDLSNFFQRAQNAWAGELAEQFTNGPIADFVRWNYGVDAPIPVFRFDDLNPDDVSFAFTLLQNIATSPKTNLPTEFVTSLVMEVGRDMGMDLDKLQQSIDKWTLRMEQDAQTQQEMAQAQLQGALNAGMSAVQQGGGAGA